MCDINGCGHQKDLPEIVIGDQTKRNFVKGLISLPLAAVLAVPSLARAAANSTAEVTLITRGGKNAAAALAAPSRKNAPAVLLIHEWWGLNDQIKSVAAEFANLGYLALAVDLYHGNVTDNADEARSLMQGVDSAEAIDALVSWVDWLKNHPHSNGRVGAVGWCFGGGWSLTASTAAPVDATVVYYGRVDHEASALSRLQGPVLGHFATRDAWIDEKMVNGFERAMESAGKGGNLSVHWYEADHAFANPSSARYDDEDAALAWRRTTEFLRMNLG